MGSLFIFVLFLGFLYYILLAQSSSKFVYDHSGSIVKVTMLYVRNLLRLTFFQVVENLTLKKGLKITIPNFNTRNEQGFLLCEYYNLKICLGTYLLNLILAISIMGIFFFFIFF